jgi:hypothetical protein
MTGHGLAVFCGCPLFFDHCNESDGKIKQLTMENKKALLSENRSVRTVSARRKK